MRKPLFFLLVLFSFWVWSLDFIDILFYYARQPYNKITGSIIALLPFGILTYLFTNLFFKHYGLTKQSLLLRKEYIKEYLYLFVFFLPILYLNFSRVIFPDMSYDTGAYHMFLQELNRYENLKNFNMVGGPGGGTYFFTLSYKMFGYSRQLLGFRLGTLFNTFLLFTCFVSIYDLIRMILRSFLKQLKVPHALIALSCLFIIYADNTLFVLNSYMVDLIGIPFLLELIIIILFRKLTDQNSFIVTFFFFLLSSLLVAYKLTYLPYLLVLGLCFIIRNYFYIIKTKSILLLAFVTAFFPSIYLLYNYTETLNPIFPFYNKIFKSPLYGIINFKDGRWGPRTISETFYYNIICAIDKKRNNEWGFFSVRLLAEYLILLSCAIYLIYNRFKLKTPFTKLIISVSGITIMLNYMLLLVIGYYRYGIIIEMLFGLCIILWLLYFFQHKRYLLFSAVLILASLQCVNTFNRIYKHGTNLSWYDYKSLWKNKKGEMVRDQIPWLLKDKHTSTDPVVSQLKIDAFLSSDCDGYIKLLAPGTPIYNITSLGNRPKAITDFENNVIDTLSQKHNLYSLARLENLPQKIRDWNTRNYLIDTIINIYPSFTTKATPLYLLKLKHYNPDSFKIATLDSFLRDNSPEIKENFSYKPKSNFKLFVILDPYSYSWLNKHDTPKFKLNDNSYSFNMSDFNNRILVLQGDAQLSFYKENEFNYLVIIQDLQRSSKQE